MKMKKLLIGGAATTVAGAILMACGGGSDAVSVSSGTVIQNATVVNTRDGSLATGMNVVVDAGKVQRVTSASVQLSGTAVAVDGTGKFVVPGFNDMHTHSLATADLPQSYYPLMIANGVTGIREMSGSADLITRARKLNADGAAGTVDAPEVLLVPGVIFGGQATTAATAAAFVDAQKAAGADFSKLTGGNREAVLSVLAESKAQGLDVAGHLAPAVSALESTNLGWKAIEHLGSGWGLLLDCADQQTAIRTSVTTPGVAYSPPFPATYVVNPRLYDSTVNAPFYQRILDSYNDTTCQNLATSFATNGTWQVPTLIRLRTQDYGADPTYRADPNLQYIDKTTRALWESMAAQFVTNVPASAATTLTAYYAKQLQVTKMMKTKGVKMLAGSDLGGIWIIPGFGLHQEFKELSKAGLSPLEILQMTTLNAAEFTKRDATMGTVDEGKNANLVLLDANPIADVANLDKISGVFLRGKYFSKTALDTLKSSAAAAYTAQPMREVRDILDPSHTD